MNHRAFATLFVAIALLLWTPPALAGQPPDAARGTWSPPVTPWGHPDLQGTWSNASTTPLERPADLAGKAVLTDEERAARNLTAGLSDDRPSGDPVGFYNDYWLEQGELSQRTSLIVDPEDGRLPPTTTVEQQLQSTRMSSGSAIAGLRFTSWEDFNALDRCITRGLPGAMMPGVFYNHNYLIVQTPDYVAIVIEMVHDVRIIPLRERPALPSGMRQWLGASRGRWEGNTLVVESANFTDKIRQRGGTVLSGGESTRLVERFTRVDADTIDYRVTVTDPTVWDGQWTAAAPMTATPGPLFEYACHEGNYAIPNALRGSRAAEQEETSK
ncbi:MAG: hypothetical protein OXF27_19185 [Acidobacteria bacterium]|nr:hypothetical protein [Acidobacteriota bacterium]